MHFMTACVNICPILPAVPLHRRAYILQQRGGGSRLFLPSRRRGGVAESDSDGEAAPSFPPWLPPSPL